MNLEFGFPKKTIWTRVSILIRSKLIIHYNTTFILGKGYCSYMIYILMQCTCMMLCRRNPFITQHFKIYLMSLVICIFFTFFRQILPLLDPPWMAVHDHMLVSHIHLLDQSVQSINQWMLRHLWILLHLQEWNLLHC